MGGDKKIVLGQFSFWRSRLSHVNWKNGSGDSHVYGEVPRTFLAWVILLLASSCCRRFQNVLKVGGQTGFLWANSR
jgi:hypothetical protein